MRINDFHIALQQNDHSEELMPAWKELTMVKDLKRLAGDESVTGWIPWDTGFDQTPQGH